MTHGIFTASLEEIIKACAAEKNRAAEDDLMPNKQEKPACDCLNWCGDDPWLDKGKARHCDDFKAREKAAALVEMIAWKLPADAMPDDDTVVLGFFDDIEEGEPVWPCLHVDNQWLIADGFPTNPPKAWAPMPGGPRNTPWMKVRK